MLETQSQGTVAISFSKDRLQVGSHAELRWMADVLSSSSGEVWDV